MSRIVPALLTAVLAFLLTGCYETEPSVSEQQQVAAEQRTEEAPAGGTEGTEGGEAGGGEPTFVAVDIDYAEAPAEVPAGESTWTLVNEGTIEHDVVIEELGDQLVVLAQPGESANGTVTLEPGDYTYYCSIPGHRAAGMEGTLTATE